MKKRILHLAQTGVLGIALAVATGCPEAAETVQVPLVNAEAEKVDKGEISGASASALAIPDNTTGEVKQQLAPVIPNLSPGLAEIVRLAQAKVGEDVLLAYIARSTFPYNPTTEEIIYLHDLGVSDAVVAEIIKRSPRPEALTAEPKNTPTEPLNIPAVPAVATSAAPAGPVLTPLVSTNPGPAYVEQQTVVVQQQPVVIQQPIVIQQAPEEVRYFYSSLAPYGSWVEVSGYGWCWQPTVAVTYAGWQPYQQSGRWLHTDYGWYWQSDYSWGWAPFHYGRWFNHPRRGWCWTPDRVWGPAWVSWRTSSSYCGWAPLPPAARYRHGFGLSYYDRHVGISFEFGLGVHDYTFVGYDHFYSHNPYNYCLPRSQVTRVYNQTTVNNIIVQGNNNNVVISQGGAQVTQIAKASRTEVQKVNVMDMPAAQRSGVQPDRLVRSGNTLAVYRPSGPGAARLNQEPSKVAISSTTPAGRPSGSLTKRDQAPANLQPGLVNNTPSTRQSAPTTALQRYETPKGADLPVLNRPQSSTPLTSRNLGMPTQPAGTGIDRPLTPQQPVQPASISSGRVLTYKPPTKRPPEATRPMTPPQPISGQTVTLSSPQPVSGSTVIPSAPRPVYGAPATPSASRPVQPATPAQSRLTPQTPVSSYQPPPTAALRTEPSRPSEITTMRPGGTYGSRQSEQPTYNVSRGTVSLPRASNPPSRPTTSYTTPSYSQPTTTYSQPTPTYSRPTPTYSQPTPTYSAPAQPQRPTYTPAPTRVEPARPSYSAPAAPRPSYTPPAPRSVAPQSVTLPPVSSRPSVGNSPLQSSGGGRSTPSQGGNDNKRPGSR